jgi:hypothetical protein
MHRRPALLITGFAVLTVLSGSAAAGGRGVIAVPGSAAAAGRSVVAVPRSTAGSGPAVISRHPAGRHSFKAAGFRGPIVFPYVRDPVPVVVPVPVPVPVPVAAPPTAEAAPPPPPEEPSRRPAVINPGSKIIDISPPAPGAKTVPITVHRGSSTVVETVPVR